MAAPKTQMTQMTHHNPGATAPLVIPVMVVCNTSDDDLMRNIRRNSAKVAHWARMEKPHKGVAVMVGGGGSVSGEIDNITRMQAAGAKVFAMNGASKWARGHGINVDYQVVADAKQETATLVDPLAKMHLFASQCHPDTIAAGGDNLRLWHLGIEGMEDEFPPERVKQGGYVLVGGGAAVGNSALCLAYTMGYREFHIFGYDSCHRDGNSHAYDQPMNRFIPCVDVEWGGRKFTASVAMKAQAEKFQLTGQTLVREGCEFNLYGDGLLQTMWNTDPELRTERDKYRLLWQTDAYRAGSPGEQLVGQFLEQMKPDGLIIDFGCGTGRAMLRLAEMGHNVIGVDFADNCRDEEAMGLPFLEWDLTQPCPIRGTVGICTDVMEHIPPEDVVPVLTNIMEAVPRCFFQIATRPDLMGAMIGATLHLTVEGHDWWRGVFESLGLRIVKDHEGDGASIFVVDVD